MLISKPRKATIRSEKEAKKTSIYGLIKNLNSRLTNITVKRTRTGITPKK